MQPTESAVIVAVPEAEPVVRPWRARLDPAAGWGVPAHLTVLYPFLPPAMLDEYIVSALTDVVAHVAPFAFSLVRTAWFDRAVLWLQPEPDAAIRELIRSVCERFPDYPPYGGVHTEVVPHLTIGDRAPSADLVAAEAAVAAELPIRAQVSALQLIHGSDRPDSWRLFAELPLSAGPPSGRGQPA